MTMLMLVLTAVGTPALVAVAGLSASIALVTWTLLARPRASKQAVANLQLGFVRPGDARPVAADGGPSTLQTIANRLTPATRVRLLTRLHLRAGYPAAWPVQRLIVIKVVLPVVVAGLSLLYFLSTGSLLAVLIGVVATVVGHFLPELLLYSQAQKRSEQIALELADTLDQMTIAVEAGMGFEAAMSKAGRNGTGPLAAELMRTLQEIQVGHTRREAYESLASRSDVPDLRRFIRAVIQADMYGVSIADVLRTQASEMRMKRRQRAEEKAMQIPVKVIFPLMFCILPVLFIVLLGPAAMDIFAAFS